MKKSIYLIIALMFVATSCNIDRFPKGSLDKGEIDKDPETYLPYVMNGCYASLKTWADQMHRCGEYAGDNINIRGGSSDAFFEFISYVRTPNNWRLDSFWNDSYRVIANTSNLLNSYKEGISDNVDNNLAEAYFMRGTMYFYLCRAMGRPYYENPETNLGMPIVNGTPEDILGTLPNRSTVKETYDQAISDLKNAERLFNNSDKSVVYGSKEAAQAILSRVYLYMSGTYENPNAEFAQLSVDYANKVIDSGRFELLDRDAFMKYNEEVPEKNKESIFVVKRLNSEFKGSDYHYTVGGMYSTIQGVGWGEMYASQKYIDLLDETGRNDWRPDSYNMVDARAAFIRPNYAEVNGKVDTRKVFRFVEKMYPKKPNLQDNSLIGYNYKQLDIITEGGKLMVVDTVLVYSNKVDGKGFLIPEKETDASGKEVNKKVAAKYELEVINANQGTYTVKNYNEGNNQSPILTDIKGVEDYRIRLNNAFPMFYVIKCSLESGFTQLHSPVIIRLGEVYLNRAEAYAKLGNYGAALDDLNKIRERSIIGGGYQSIDATTAPALIDKERQLELAYQAERSYDVFRNGNSLERKYPGAHDNLEVIPANDYRTIYFIPQKAINDYNGTLTQNPTSN